MSKTIFDDPELQKEHEALHDLACIIAEKWKGQLLEQDCSFSADGLLWFYEDVMGDDMETFRTLYDRHKKNIEEYRAKKRTEKEAENDGK